MVHILIFMLAVWIPTKVDTSRMQPRVEPEKNLGNDVIDFRVSSALRESHWELRSDSEDLNAPDSSQDIVTTNYDMNTSLLREYNLMFNAFDTSVGLVYAKNDARNNLGERDYAAVEKISGYFGFDDIFDNGGKLIARYKYETVGGIATIEDGSGVESPPVSFVSKYKTYMLAEEFPDGVYIGASHNESNLPMGVGFEDTTGAVKAYLDSDLSIRSTKFVFGGSSTNVALNRTRFYKGVYSNIEAGIGLFTYEHSNALKSQVINETGVKPSNGGGVVVGGNFEVGYAIHKRFKRLSDLGFSVELGLSLEGDWYQSISSLTTEKDKSDIQFERKDFRYGPIARLTAVF